MNRSVSGTIPVEGRVFKYIQSAGVKDFTNNFRKIGMSEKSELPKSGGMITENVKIKLPNDILMFGISYKGDLDAWERNINKFCRDSNLLQGVIQNEHLIISNGDSFALADCEIEFF